MFESRPFAHIWFATVLGLVGIAMSDAATAWIVTETYADPRIVSLVQVAAFAPMFVFTLPAGVLIDLVEPRPFLLMLETIITVIVIAFATVITMGFASPMTLLALTFVLSAAWSVAAPAWAALTPALVPRSDIEAAAAANSVGYYFSRAVGPLIGARLMLGVGIAAPFWGFAVANIASVIALLVWKPPAQRRRDLPAERLFSALRAGLRHALYNPHLRATIVRTFGVFPFAAAFLALLPLVARREMSSSPELYAFLVATVSAGAAVGSIVRPYAKARLGPDRFVALGTVFIAAGMTLLGASSEMPLTFVAMFLAGAGWTSVLASLSVSAQVALPDWVRGRGLSIFLSSVFLCIAVGSVVWGFVAKHLGLPAAFYLAAAGAIGAIPFVWSWRLQTAEGVDLSPSMHWQAPILKHAVEDDSGPVLVTLRYRLAKSCVTNTFLDAVEEVGKQRRRDGAYAWGIFADVANAGVYLETFLVGSWLEARYLRERVTNADRAREEQLKQLLAEPPLVSLMVASDAPRLESAPVRDLDFYLAASEKAA